MVLFNRNLVRSFRNSSRDTFADHCFLFDEIALIVLQKLKFFLIDPRSSFFLSLGARNGFFLKALLEDGLVEKSSNVVQCDISEHMFENVEGDFKVVADEELLPFPNGMFHVVTSIMSLHNVNNLLKVLSKINLLLKRGGIFIGTLFGVKTLNELKKSIAMAEIDSCAVAVSRILPFFTIQEVGNMLQKSGYTDPVVDVDVIDVSYSHITNLFDDLKGMGESNVLICSRRPFRKVNIEKSYYFYKKYFSNDGITIPATFEIITMSGVKG